MSSADRAPFLESDAPTAVDCYVRTAVPATLVGTIDAVADRLERLSETDAIAEYRIRGWPPENDALAESAANETRDELVSAFEAWADERGHTLEPAFRRERVPSSPPGTQSDDRRERVRVPIVALAVRDREADRLRGVVPHTADPGTDAERTRTVTEWLRAAEATKTPESETAFGSTGGTTLLEGRR
ncbi:HTH domain-containing protein [Natrialbaceae archaeon GCM10025810]|uniref:HTH domain-containing protein n=1 Tax=Halovalidus salilacus TaxID=3075124 RepID=UPI00360A2875